MSPAAPAPEDKVQSYLFILNEGPYGQERPYTGLRLAVNTSPEPVTNIGVSLGENLGIGAVFTIISFVRSFLLRRIFNGFGAARSAGI